MLYTKIQPKSFLGSGEENFKYFYHIWAWQPFCLVVQNYLNKLLVLLDRRPPVKSDENWQVVSQAMFKDLYDLIHVQSLWARADTPRG